MDNHIDYNALIFTKDSVCMVKPAVIIPSKGVIYYMCALKGIQPTEMLHQQRLDLKGCHSHPAGQITTASGQHKWAWKIAQSAC